MKNIVFIHGNSLSALSFKGQQEFFKDENLMFFELPGHGNNKSDSYTEEDYSIEGFVSHLVKFVSKNNLTNFIFVGHSLGGHIAIEAMNEFTGLKGVFIYGAPPIARPANIEQAFLPSPLVSLLFQEKHTVEELDLLSKGFTSNENERENIITQIQNTYGALRPLIAKAIGEQKHKDEKKLVETIDIPIAVIHGENEPFANLDYLETMKWRNLWKNKIHIIKNAAHSPHLENPVEFNNLLSQFCETVFE
jgi:pimeloyl-ACP methyl ester carboxylesterase